ncbi:Insulin-induced protein 1 protein [Haplosporangium bisporale]|nr:Insulin-induced protein 1 protein [Haplosporangium bisporale]KFH65498.1 hypothetical protein MVEG_08976 [Podila verticillata NRRL 6337]
MTAICTTSTFCDYLNSDYYNDDYDMDMTMAQDDMLHNSPPPYSSAPAPTPSQRYTCANTILNATIVTTTTTTTTTTTITTPPASPIKFTFHPNITDNAYDAYDTYEDNRNSSIDNYDDDDDDDDGDDYLSSLSPPSSSFSGFPLTADGPYLFVFDMAISLYFPVRALVLFLLGFVFSLVIDHLQTQHHLVEYPSNISQLWDTASWLPPTCGASAVLIGTIYPLGDYFWWGKRVERNSRDWSSVMRCMGGFIGVNYAASKLPWTSSLQVSCTLALISVALWFLFDRTVHGFVISLVVASMGTVVAYFLVLNGWYSFTRADFFGVASWIPCILYSSSVCFGSIGRQLDVVPEAWFSNSVVHLKTE